MVLCNYFINGQCRFGSKCVNDHIDLKTLLKSEVEAAVNGKQWLLSCFGPFKESAVLPNFIPDRSFEEVRLSFMEASKSGNTQQHINELISQYNDAMTKLTQLKMSTPDTINLIANIYNQSVQQDTVKTSPTPATNVFSLSNAAQQQQAVQNPFQMGSVFGSAQQQQQQTTMSSGSIFGGVSTNNPFQSSTQNSIFGGSKDPPAPAVTSNFTFSLGQQAPQQQQQQQSIFSSSPQSPPQNSIFGSSQPLQQQQQTSIFSSQSSTFGSMFPSAAPQQQPGNTSFASTVFAQPAQAPPAPSGIFGMSQETSNPSNFPQSSSNIFTQFQATQPANTGNLFAQPTPPPSQNIFGIQQTQPSLQQPPPPPTGSIFQVQQPNPNNTQQTFGGNPFQTQQPAPIDESVYSRPEDLTPEELQAFQAETFQVGKIPLKPPPKHLC